MTSAVARPAASPWSWPWPLHARLTEGFRRAVLRRYYAAVALRTTVVRLRGGSE